MFAHDRSPGSWPGHPAPLQSKDILKNEEKFYIRIRNAVIGTWSHMSDRLT